MQACSSPGNCDGSFTVNEPIGAQSWFPCNDHPSDKATFSCTRPHRAPTRRSAPASGPRIVDNGDGTSTTTWVENTPMATYLSTGTVGMFDVEESTMTDHSNGADDPDLHRRRQRRIRPATRRTSFDAADRIPEIVNFLSRKLGSYPFETVGVVADWVPSVGYELENQTKPHFAGNKGGPAADVPTLAHELAHQWMGDSISPATWSEIWFNEGWATVLAGPLRPRGGRRRSGPRSSSSAPSTRPRGSAWNLRRRCSTTTRRSSSAGSPSTPGPARCSRASVRSSATRSFFRFAKQLGAKHGGGTINRRQFVTGGQAGEQTARRKAEAAGELLPPVAALGQAPAAHAERLLDRRHSSPENGRGRQGLRRSPQGLDRLPLVDEIVASLSSISPNEFDSKEQFRARRSARFGRRRRRSRRRPTPRRSRPTATSSSPWTR